MLRLELFPPPHLRLVFIYKGAYYFICTIRWRSDDAG